MQFLIQGVCKKCLEIENINVGDASFRGELTFTNITISHLRAKRLKLFSFVITVHTAIRNDSKLKEITAEYFALNKAIINDKMEIEKCRLTKIVLGPLEDSSSGSIHFYDNYQIDDAHLLLDTLKGIEINHGFFKKLTFSGTAKQKLIVQNINVEWLRLINVFNETSITFTSVTVPSISTITRSSHGVLEITSSNLGKADFLKCNFSQALFDFENSKIAEIFCSATTFPRRPINKTQEAYSQVQLAYGQLSAAFNKQGDSVRAYTYQSREIAAHFHNTSWKSADFFVWLNLALNKISNNFGRWWALGIVFTFLVGGLLFYLVVINSNEYSLGWGFDFNWDLFSSFLKFMNPLRFFDTESLFKLNENPPYLTLTRWSYFWDFFGRVFVAYGYYQTIQAFRRFGRK